MRAELSGHGRRLSPLGKVFVYASGRDLPAPIGEPQRRFPGRLAEQGANLFYILGQTATAQAITEATARRQAICRASTCQTHVA